MITNKMTGLALAAAATFALSATTVPASAQLARSPAAIGITAGDHNGGVTQVRWRGHRGWHGHRGYGHRGYYGHRGGIGPGAVIGGLAAGALIGGALAAQQPVYGGGDAVAYCESRFRSYDPASGTYLGYDGLRHACP